MTLAEVTAAFEGFDGVWAPYQTLDELYEDEAVVANGYLPAMTAGNGQEVQLVASPAQFDEQPFPADRAPEHGEHTEMILMDLGYDWDRITALKEAGSVL
jgi:crotonobetainyl-CoA:carnitine CoA-transferase CaiB-like acyl-CoA transferase